MQLHILWWEYRMLSFEFPFNDVQATLCRYNSSTKKLQALPLTTDHTPTLYEERMRIQKAGGYVRCVDIIHVDYLVYGEGLSASWLSNNNNNYYYYYYSCKD